MSKAETNSHGNRTRPRQEVGCTALAVLPGRERMGKVIDLAEGGAGLVLQGTEHQPGEQVVLVLVIGSGTLAFRGTVVFVRRLHRASRVGIRFDFSAGGNLADGARWTGGESVKRGDGLRGSRRLIPSVDCGRRPARFNAGVAGPLLAPHDALALRRDTSMLLRSLRRKGLSVGRISYGFLLDLLRQRRIPAGVNRVARELFRTLMNSRYPSFPGSTIQGRVLVPTDDFDGSMLAGAAVMLDRFAVAQVGSCGSFSAEGIPVPDAPVLLPVSVRGPGLVTTEEVLVSLRAGEATSLFVEVPIRPVRRSPPREDELELAYRGLCAIRSASGAGGVTAEGQAAQAGG